MQEIKRPSLAIVLTLALIIGAQPAAAMTVTLTGDTVIYKYDTEVNADALKLLGNPEIEGDKIRFLPPVLGATSSNMEGPLTVMADFLFSSVATIGAAEITGVEVMATGDYEITGDGRISSELMVAITNSAEKISDSVVFARSGDSGGQQDWELNSILNPADAFDSIADDIALSIKNTLTASSNTLGKFARVQTKLEFAVSTTAGIALAEPGSLGLFALGLVGALYSRRRRALPATR